MSDVKAAVLERPRQELASPSYVFCRERRGEELGANLAGSPVLAPDDPFATEFDRRLFLENRRSYLVVYGGYVLHLLPEVANAFEFAARRHERILVFGHGLGRGGKFTLHAGDRAVQSLRDGRVPEAWRPVSVKGRYPPREAGVHRVPLSL